MIYLVADTHGKNIVMPKDCHALIHLGDWCGGDILYEDNLIGSPFKILVRGNHDKNVKANIFSLIADGILIDGIWFSHEPVDHLPKGAHLNVHGHLHENDYEDYGYVKKPFHVCLTPNVIYTLEGFTGESHA